jgi:methylated-DNA-[protein]-cysteine S-methyltransferase
MGIAWSDRGVTHLQLPEAGRGATLSRLMQRAGGAAEADPPRGIAETILAVRRLAEGDAVDLRAVEVDLADVDAFRRAIYAAARRLGFGETTTYGTLAAEAGYPGLARETGQAMGSNPVPLIVPCHRVLAAGGKLGGFSAPGGTSTKRRLLELERARAPSPPGQSAFAF